MASLEAEMSRLNSLYELQYGNVNLAMVVGEFGLVLKDLRALVYVMARMTSADGKTPDSTN